VELKPEEFYPSHPACHHRGKVLIEDDGEDGCGKGRVCKIIHGPANDLTFLNRHIMMKMFLGKGKEAGLVQSQNVRCKNLRINDITLQLNWHLNHNL